MKKYTLAASIKTTNDVCVVDRTPLTRVGSARIAAMIICRIITARRPNKKKDKGDDMRLWIVEGEELDWPAIRQRIPIYIQDTTIKARLKRLAAKGKILWKDLRIDPKLALQNNGKRAGTYFNKSFKTSMQASVDRAVLAKTRSKSHGW